jgi:hypothetical protein
METFKKRQKALLRKEKQQKKAARRMERRNEKARSTNKDAQTDPALHQSIDSFQAAVINKAGAPVTRPMLDGAFSNASHARVHG